MCMILSVMGLIGGFNLAFWTWTMTYWNIFWTALSGIGTVGAIIFAILTANKANKVSNAQFLYSERQKAFLEVQNIIEISSRLLFKDVEGKTPDWGPYMFVNITTETLYPLLYTKELMRREQISKKFESEGEKAYSISIGRILIHPDMVKAKEQYLKSRIETAARIFPNKNIKHFLRILELMRELTRVLADLNVELELAIDQGYGKLQTADVNDFDTSKVEILPTDDLRYFISKDEERYKMFIARIKLAKGEVEELISEVNLYQDTEDSKVQKTMKLIAK